MILMQTEIKRLLVHKAEQTMIQHAHPNYEKIIVNYISMLC